MLASYRAWPLLCWVQYLRKLAAKDHDSSRNLIWKGFRPYSGFQVPLSAERLRKQAFSSGQDSDLLSAAVSFFEGQSRFGSFHKVGWSFWRAPATSHQLMDKQGAWRRKKLEVHGVRQHLCWSLESIYLFHIWWKGFFVWVFLIVKLF